MQCVAEHNGTYILSIPRGGELIESLKAFCTERKIAAAHCTGLGAADTLELAYYNLTTKEYERHQLHDEVEILSLTGNISTAGDTPLAHLHGVFGKRDLTTFGGHIFSLRVSGACELHLTALSTAFTRKHDPETGLNLMCAL